LDKNGFLRPRRDSNSTAANPQMLQDLGQGEKRGSY
jgi:hypothetical protein